MKNRLVQLSKGNVEFRKPELSFSLEKLSGTAYPDRISKASVDVTSVNRVPVELVLHSSDPRVIVSKNVSVAVAGKISVDVDASGLVIGDEIQKKRSGSAAR